ncbi:DEAD/DEAH box helicase [Amycolatopsis sp. NPDC003861]
MKIQTANVWARSRRCGGNDVRQLLVPAAADWTVVDKPGELAVSGRFGTWPAVRGATAAEDGPLTAGLPTVDQATHRISWSGSRAPVPPEAVRESFAEAIGFRSHDEPNSLRRPQIGALHAIVGFQASGVDEPALVVMPTGTGKTETMLAWTVAARPELLLVVVPTAALRDQIAAKFERLGVLQELEIVAPHALRPNVGRLEHALKSVADVAELAAACNVIVATPHVLHLSDADARRVLFDVCSHLIVDEAHHAPADTWTHVIRSFPGARTLLFTATPFRGDGRRLPGRVIFRFPLREAQRDGHFSTIEFRSVVGIEDVDEELAAAAVARLREDLAAGLDHVLLARVKTKVRAAEILELYEHLAPELGPAVLHDTVTVKQRKAVLANLDNRACRIVICVDMLGEGFDLPALKVAAIHDSRQSLSPMLQLIGRLARTSSPTEIGRASVFVARDPAMALSPMRDLLREDPDWDVILSDVTERATRRALEVGEFDESFPYTPVEVPIGLLEPKMSAIAYSTAKLEWEPDKAKQVYPGMLLDDLVSVNTGNDFAWFVLRAEADPRWGRVPGLENRSFDLVMLYFDRDHGMLYVHGSNTKAKYDRLVEVVLDEEPSPVNGMRTFRVLAHIDRLIPTNLGLLDARDRDRRFSMHVGSDVEAALQEAESDHKTQTHIATKGFEDGESVTISAALSGRFWAMATARNLFEWREWCDRQGAKLRDRTLDLTAIFRRMLFPTEITARPPHPLLALEWPWDLYLGTGTATRAEFDGMSHILTDIEFRVDDHGSAGPFVFSLVSADWEVGYSAEVGPDGLHYTATGRDATATMGRVDESVPLAEWLNRHKPTLFLSGDRMITGDDRLLEPREGLRPYDPANLITRDWRAQGVNIRVESQGVDRKKNSIQAFMVRELQRNRIFDVLIDDDGKGEAADLVGLRVDGNDLVITLVHCKYSSGDDPGARLEDLYEVCGQAIRGARWRDGGGRPLLEHLERRTRAYRRRHPGKTAFEVGDSAALLRIREQAPLLFPRLRTLVVQPGLSAARCTDEQLRLLAGAETYVRAVTKGTFEVHGSD